jgi:DNA-binding helix-hairpin-helix protein with protein kinase domain
MKVFNMSSIKLLPMLAVPVSMGAISAQAHTVSQANVVTPTVQSWVTNFGFLPFNSTSCTDVQTGFSPRPLDCKR